MSTLPPPAPRLMPLGADLQSERPPSVDPLLRLQSMRPPRLRLEPGLGVTHGEPLTPTVLPTIEGPSRPFDDPLNAIEQRIAALEATGATGPERARNFCALAEVWRERFHSIERACLAYREATAADPTDTALLQQAALHCYALGQEELALGYATSAVATAGIAVERATALCVQANIERAAGNVEHCIHLLAEAALEDPSNPQPHQQLMALWVERGDLRTANAHARLAATALQEDAPHRASALLGWGLSLAPKDAATAYEYASVLDADGYRLMAAAVLGETAVRSEEPTTAHRLRLAAAARAAAAQRPDIAAEYLVEAFDAEPGTDLVGDLLLQSLSALPFVEYRAAVCEDIAALCPVEQRAHWLLQAGDALLSTEGQHEASCWLYFEALLTDPQNTAALSALRTNAQSELELTLFAHGLRAAIAASLQQGSDDAKALLRELAEVAEQRLHNGHLALAAWVQLERLEGLPAADVTTATTRLGEWTHARRLEMERAEQALAQCAEEERGILSRNVALLLPDLPEHWGRRIELLDAALSRNVEVDVTRRQLETLYGLQRNAAALAAFLEDQAELALERNERIRILLRLCAVHTVREDTAAVVAACQALLALQPDCRPAIARLMRAARKLGDGKLLTRAFSLRLATTLAPRERARALVQLARLAESADLQAAAAEHAAAAIHNDETAVDAGLLLLRHIHRLDAHKASAVLDALEANSASSRALESARAQVATVAGDVERAQAAIERWIHILPCDGAAHRAHILSRLEGTDGKALLAAVQTTVSAVPIAEVLDATRDAVDRLEALNCPALASELALGIIQQQGKMDLVLVTRAVALARQSGAPEILGRALEQQAVATPDGARAAMLLELAAHHREHADPAAEMRTLLRVLECPGDHNHCLYRLHTLFAQAGDSTRLSAVSELLLAAETVPARRRVLLLELTASAAGGRDVGRAEFYVRTLVAENAADLVAVREALGVMLSLGECSWALERCLAVADDCPPPLGSYIYLWCALTAEARMGDRPFALDIAKRGVLKFRSTGELLLLTERLTLATDDAALALSLYDALIDAAMGMHGRRALLYRAGRWLERANRPEKALDRYLLAFDLAPAAGAAFSSLLRVAKATGHTPRVVHCYERLAEVTREDTARLRLLCKASELCLDELGDRRRAFELLLRANNFSDHFELDDRLTETAQKLRASDPDIGQAALSSLTEDLEQRLGRLFAAPDKARCLLRLAALYSDGASNRSRAEEHLDAVIALADDEELPPELVADAQAARASLHSVPNLPLPGLLPTMRPNESTALKEAIDRLRSEIIAEPWHPDAWRSLAMLCSSPGQRAELHVIRQLLSHFDPDISAPPDIAFHSGLWRGTALREAIGEPLPPAVAGVLRMLWEHARIIPRFRNPLGQFGVDERDRITRITVGPVAEAYAQAARMLGANEVQVYISQNNRSPARTLPTHPPCVLAGRGIAQEEATLLYTMARALWLAQPEHVIGGVLAPSDASDLLEGAAIAFGGASAGEPRTSAKELAALLWQSVPTREQQRFSEVLRTDADALRYPQLYVQTTVAAARAALLTAGSLYSAIRVLSSTEAELAGLALSQEHEFALGCERSPALAEIVRCAFSAAYLSRLERML